MSEQTPRCIHGNCIGHAPIHIKFDFEEGLETWLGILEFGNPAVYSGGDSIVIVSSCTPDLSLTMSHVLMKTTKYCWLGNMSNVYVVIYMPASKKY